MIRYTTPVDTLIVEGVNLSSYTVYATFKQIVPDDVDTNYINSAYYSNGASNDDVTITIKVTSKSVSGSNTVLSVSLTQAQTAKLYPGVVRVQVNWLQGSKRYATDIVKVPVYDNLHDEELS